MRFLLIYISLLSGCAIAEVAPIESNQIKIILGSKESIKIINGKIKYIIDDTTIIRTNIKINIPKIKTVFFIDEIAETEQCMNQTQWRKKRIATYYFDPKINTRSINFDMKLPCVRFLGKKNREKEIELKAIITTEGNKVYYHRYKILVIIQNPMFF